jgi:hypothetical protein
MLLTHNNTYVPHILPGQCLEHSPIRHPDTARHYESIDNGPQHWQHVEQEVQNLQQGLRHRITFTVQVSQRHLCDSSRPAPLCSSDTPMEN